ncbi:hypothetical protein CFD26_102506 [Aspergillus turcosus]|uniref:DNA repair protein rad9 n=1 Tax=Aspergillus turcosus TaxID=1245748 RepID=A0A3R7HQ83_9EURO|nr:hypothetical protein CFD26_102506 [Aspergillus turcosus]
MTSLFFSLNPEALGRIHDALLCLAKFSETVSIEAESALLRLSVINSSKTAYAAFVLDGASFFTTYSFSHNGQSENVRSDRFCCQIYLKALLSIFKGRTTGRDKDTAVERCEFELNEDPDETECVIRTYKLTYEPTTTQHAIFDRSSATNKWSIEPRFLKEITDHFSPSAEQLDIYSDGGKAIFTSFTTKITDGQEILKQPVHTSVAIDKRDFEEFSAEDELHIAITLKDFKAIITHAETTGVLITARYTRPCRPLQLAYDFDGVRTEFTLMTTGENDSEDIPSSRAAVPELSARQTPAPVHISQNNAASNTEQMPPSRSRSIRPLTGTTNRVKETNVESQQPPPPSIHFDSLFVPADDDRQWDVPNEEDETMAEDTLGWDATADQETFNASLGPRLRDTEPVLPHESKQQEPQDEMGIPPTQRISQLRGLGLFD